MAIPRESIRRFADFDKMVLAESDRIRLDILVAITPACWSVLLSVPAYRNPFIYSLVGLLTLATLVTLCNVRRERSELTKNLIVVPADPFYAAIKSLARDYRPEQCVNTNAKTCWLCRLLNRKRTH